MTLSISCESSVTSWRRRSVMPFPSGLFPVRPDVSSDIAPPVEAARNRWSLTFVCVCVLVLSRLHPFSLERCRDFSEYFTVILYIWQHLSVGRKCIFVIFTRLHSLHRIFLIAASYFSCHSPCLMPQGCILGISLCLNGTLWGCSHWFLCSSSSAAEIPPVIVMFQGAKQCSDPQVLQYRPDLGSFLTWN